MIARRVMPILACLVLFLQGAIATQGLWHHHDDHHDEVTHEQSCAVCVAVNSPTGSGLDLATFAIQLPTVITRAPDLAPARVDVLSTAVLRARGPPII